MAYEGYNAYLSVNGSSPKEVNTIRTKTVIENDFKNNIAYYLIELNRANITSPIQTDTWILDDSDSIDQKKVVSLSPITYGDYFEWRNQYWIIAHVDNMHDIYYSGKVRQCYTSLKWLDQDGISKEAVCAQNNVSPGIGIQDGQIITLGNERRQIILQYNDDTKKIKKSQRFIFDNRAWKVISIDGLQNGLLKLQLEETTIIDSRDNLELRIADYYGNVADLTIQILNGDTFTIRAGSTLQLQTEVRNRGEIVTKDIIYESSDNTIASIDSNGLVTTYANGQVILTAKIKDYPDIQDTASLNVQFDQVHNYSVELNTSPIVILSDSVTFTAIVKDNLVVAPNMYVMWYLMNDDGVTFQTDVASMMMSSTTQCTLKGLKIGYCQLVCQIIGTTVKQTFRVQVKSLV